MKLILTITLNPAVDRTIEISHFGIDKVNRVTSVRRDIGGKGLNVTKTIVAMGGASKALLVLGGKNGNFIKEKSLSEGLNVICFEVPGETRENIKIVDPSDKTYTDINESGPEINPEFKQSLIELIKSNTGSDDWMVISGSSPTGIGQSFYKEVFEHASRHNIKVIADVNGTQLSDLIEFKPFLIKPNIDELSELFGKKIERTSEVVSYARKIIDKGVKVVVVSLGEDGLLWVSEDEVYKASALKVEVLSTVGAGDAIVAGLAWSLSQGMTIEDTLRNAVASATCVITTVGTKTGDFKDFEIYKKMIAIEKL